MNRFDKNRARGSKDEAVSSMDDRHRDDMAQAAEEWLARGLGVSTEAIIASERPDDGWDMVLNGFKIDVKWTPYEPGGRYRTPTYPHLIVPTWKPRRADIYALVIGSTWSQFDIYSWASGWETRRAVEAAPRVLLTTKVRRTSRKPSEVFAIGFDYLRRLDDLEPYSRGEM